MTVYLSAKNVSKKYGNTVALRDASLELNAGEIVALLGPNGSGKTTFIKILATLLTKDGGQVKIMDYDLEIHENKIRHSFGYVGQDTERSAYGRLTVRENLRFFGSLRGLSRRRIDYQISRLATYFDFHAYLDRLFMTLSGGQKQTVVIMRALLHDPPLVYLDEPTKGLDPIIAKGIREFLKRYAYEEHKALLLTSHILPEVDEIANRIALMFKGTISVTGTSTELKQAVGVQGFLDLRKEVVSCALQEQILATGLFVLHPSSNPEWISYAVIDYLNGMEAIINMMRAQEIRTQFRYRPVSLEDAFVHYIGTTMDGPENQEMRVG